MYKGNVVAVVVPAFNEEDHVGNVIETVPEYVDYVYAVDDASVDDTWNEIRRAARRVNESERTPRSTTHRVDGKRPPQAKGGQLGMQAGAEQSDVRDTNVSTHVVPIQHETNRGVGGSIKTGYQFALENDVDLTAVLAGDGQMDPTLLELLLEPLVEGRADYAKGNRLLTPGMRRDMPKIRYFGNVVLSGLTKIGSGYWHIGDPQNGYTVISREALEAIDFEGMYEFYGYCNDLLVKLNVKEMVVADVAMPSVYDDEQSHISYQTYIPRVSSMLLRNFLWRLKEKYVVRTFHPLVLLYGVGFIGGVVSVLQALARLQDDGERPHTDPLILQTMILSALCLVFAMLSDRRENDDLQERIRNVDRDGPESE